MTQIKNTLFYSSYKLQNVFKDSGLDFKKSDFLFFTLSFFNYFLPLRAKFLAESYIVFEKEKIQGLISVEKDERSRKRLKITKVFLEENALDSGKLLVQYIISRYCAMGAISYQVVVEDSRQDMLSLFVDGCGFRKNAQEFIYKVEKDTLKFDTSSISDGFKFFKNIKSVDVARLYNSNINSYQRHSFSKTKEQFEPYFAAGVCDCAVFSYVLEDEQKGKIYGYFNITTYNNQDYMLDFVIDSAFEVYFEDALCFVSDCLSKRVKNWNLYVKVKSFFANYKFFKEYCESNKYKLVKSSSILTKDYLKEIKENSLLNNAKIVFNDITPAFKV